ncbi:YbbR-like domain-containing protein [Anaeroselena agilis]|uniref:CdaR family protein n=1 Tax=Anaeroselena agilis TaxID=3063788 RepID=A0ABU3P0R5_9FIRM|nr:CdaR family protein [Selenomonadales bacterium 4137-cl]
MEEERGKNITTKILALIMAVVLWLYVTNEQNPPVESSVSVPLEVRGVADTLVATDSPDAVRIKVRGPRSIIAVLTPQDLKAYIDLRGTAEGRHTVRVFALVPSSLEFIEVQPDKITVRVDGKASRTLPVEIRVTGTATAGAVVAKATINPQQVTVEGPKATVDSVDRVILPLDLTGRSADFTAQLVPLLVNRDGRAVEGLTVNPGRISVVANLAKGVDKKTVDIKTIIYGDMAPGVFLKSVVTEPARVELSGNAKELEKIDFVYTEPISVAGINKDTEKEVKLQIKEGLVASQAAVTVKISVGR